MTEAYSLIVGHEQLLEWFGYWPSFHDAEVLTMSFDRRHTLYPPGPKLEARIHLFEMSNEVDAKGYFVLQKHVIATIEFDGLEQLEFSGFNHQNSLYGLAFVRHVDLSGGGCLKVHFDSSFGVECSFICRSAVLVRLEPGRPIDRTQ